MARSGAVDHLRASEAIRRDADALAVEIRAYRSQRAEDQPPRALDIAFIRHFQRRLARIHSRWEASAAAQPS